MSLDQHTHTDRYVIDLTTNPPQRYADRFALPGMPTPAREPSRPLTVVAPTAPTRSGSLQINLFNVLAVSAFAAIVMFLFGVVGSALF